MTPDLYLFIFKTKKKQFIKKILKKDFGLLELKNKNKNYLQMIKSRTRALVLLSLVL